MYFIYYDPKEPVTKFREGGKMSGISEISENGERETVNVPAIG